MQLKTIAHVPLSSFELCHCSDCQVGTLSFKQECIYQTQCQWPSIYHYQSFSLSLQSCKYTTCHRTIFIASEYDFKYSQLFETYLSYREISSQKFILIY